MICELFHNEKSSKEFHRFPDEYLHWIRPVSNTGIRLEWLQEHLLIPLDIFRLNLQNKGINNELDAWLTFLSADEPEMIEQLIKTYPQFKPMYQQMYEICRNTERVMELYSEELKILDKNTVQLMIDEMQDEIDGQKRRLIQKDEQLIQKDKQLFQKDKRIDHLSRQYKQQLQEIERLKRELAGQKQ